MFTLEYTETAADIFGRLYEANPVDYYPNAHDPRARNMVINAPLALSTIKVEGLVRFIQALALFPAGLVVGFLWLDLHWIVSLAALAAHLWVAWEIAFKPVRVT